MCYCLMEITLLCHRHTEDCLTLTDRRADSISSSTGSAPLYSIEHSLWWRMCRDVASLSSLKMVWLKTSRVSKTRAASVWIREAEAISMGLYWQRVCHCTDNAISLRFMSLNWHNLEMMSFTHLLSFCIFSMFVLAALI